MNLTNSSSHFCPSRLTLENYTATSCSNYPSAPLQQFAQMQASIWGPPVIAAFSSWAWAQLPTTTSLSSINVTNKLNIVRNKAADVADQVVSTIGSVFSYLTQSKNTNSCAAGIVALTSGQPAIQLAGIGLLTDCLKFPFVKAAQTNGTFLTTVGGAGDEYGYSVQQTQDGGFIVTGYTNSVGAGNKDLLLTKFASNGTISWTKTLGGVNIEETRSHQQTQDGGFIVTGFTNSFGAGGEDVLLAKFMANGTLSWAKTFGGPNTDVGYSVQQTQDGGFIVTGYTHSYGAGGADVILAKFTSTGTLSWTKTLGGTGPDYGQCVQQTQDGGYILTGGVSGFGIGSLDILLAKFTSTGTLSWAKALGGASVENGMNVQQAQDGGYIVTGYTDSFGAGGNDVLFAKFSSSGSLSWAKTFGGASSDVGNGVQLTEDGGFIISGYVSGFGSGSSDVFLAKFNSSGSLSWAKILGGSGDDLGYSLQKTQDGGFVVAGATQSFGSAGYNILLAKLDSKGRVLNCNSNQAFNPTISDITGAVTFTSPSPTVTSPSPTVSSWAVSSVGQTFNQTFVCPRNSLTASESFTSNRTLSQTYRESFSKSLSRFSRSQSSSRINSLTNSGSLTARNSATGSLMYTNTQSEKSTDSFSRELLKTRTKQATRTRPNRFTSSVIIQQFDLPLPGVAQFIISPSGSFVLTQIPSGFELISVFQNEKLVPAGKFEQTLTLQAATFSQDEQFLFLANRQGSIEVINIRDPNNPQSIGFVNISSQIKSLRQSGSGGEVLLGTTSGVQALSAKTPSILATMTPITSYPTPSSVTSIQTNPNTNTVAISSGNSLIILDFRDNQFTKLDEKTFSNPVKEISPIDMVNPTQLSLTLNNRDTVFVDISDPKSPIITATIPAQSSSELVTVSGSTLLVSGVKPGIQIFENEQKNWLSPREVGYSPIIDNVTNLEFATTGKFAIYSDAQGLKLVKTIKNPGRLDVPLPRLENIVKLGFPISSILLNEPNRWIALGGDRLTFISGDDLHMPKQLATVSTQGTVKQMIFFPDQTKLLIVDNAGVAYVDCFNPEAPKILGRWNSVNPINDLTLSGSYAYVCQGEMGISVLDITNPLNIVKTKALSTQKGSAQTIRFNRDRTLAYVADSSGIDVWKAQTPLMFLPIGRLPATGFVSKLALSSDEKTLYFASEQLFGKVNVTNSSAPTLSYRLDTTYPIRDIALSNQGTVGYLAVEIDGMLVVDTQNMEIKGNLPSTTAKGIYLNEYEDQVYLADQAGGMKVAQLVTELPIIPLSARTNYPVGIQVEAPLLFFNKELDQVSIDRINSIQYIDRGQKRDLPLWISADLEQKKLFITGPKELTGKTIQLALSVDINGIRQDTIYQAQISSSLEINDDKGRISIATPSPTVSVNVNLTGASFMPQDGGTLSISSKENILQAFGSVSDINQYLESVRINPNPITKKVSDVALNSAEIKAADLINLFPSNSIVRLRSFRFNEGPRSNRPMNRTNKKGLESFVVKIPADTFTDSDDPKLILSAKLSNGTTLPSWLTFNPDTATFNGYAPVSMLNQTLPITLTASDGYLSVSSTWELHIDGNQGPYVAKPIPSLTRTTGSEFSYVLPKDIFQDLDNNTLTYSAVEEGYEVLPGFLNFDPETLTFLGRPTAGDVKTYPIKITAKDQFGASAVAVMDLDIRFSNWDLFLDIFTKFGIASAAITPFTWAYYKRAFIYNCAKKNIYWRDEIPAPLLQGKGYIPKHPVKEIEIPKDEITKIQVLAFDQEKWGHHFAKEKLPTHLYVAFWANSLLNDEPLPTWLELDPDTGMISLRPDHFPTEDKSYVFQVLGKDHFILESFFINPSRISMYQAPVNIAEIISLDLGDSIELQSKPEEVVIPERSESEIPNVWADLDLEDLLNQRVDNDQQEDPPLLVDIEEPQADQEEPIHFDYLLDDESDNISSSTDPNKDQASSSFTVHPKEKWVKPNATIELEEALSSRQLLPKK